MTHRLSFSPFVFLSFFPSPQYPPLSHSCSSSGFCCLATTARVRGDKAPCTEAAVRHICIGLVALNTHVHTHTSAYQNSHLHPCCLYTRCDTHTHTHTQTHTHTHIHTLTTHTHSLFLFCLVRSCSLTHTEHPCYLYTRSGCL